MPLISDGACVVDPWTTIASDDEHLFDEVLPEGDIIVPHGRLASALQHRHKGKLGVEIDNDLDFWSLTSLIGKVDLISVRFPSCADGRGFSIAKTLRKAGFAGVLRAHGPLLADQYAFAEACGFDEIAVSDEHAERQPAAHFDKARHAFPRAYQQGFNAPVHQKSILSARHGR